MQRVVRGGSEDRQAVLRAKRAHQANGLLAVRLHLVHVVRELIQLVDPDRIVQEGWLLHHQEGLWVDLDLQLGGQALPGFPEGALALVALPIVVQD